jgi:hypothetical protein
MKRVINQLQNNNRAAQNETDLESIPEIKDFKINVDLFERRIMKLSQSVLR